MDRFSRTETSIVLNDEEPERDKCSGPSLMVYKVDRHRSGTIPTIIDASTLNCFVDALVSERFVAATRDY